MGGVLRWGVLRWAVSVVGRLGDCRGQLGHSVSVAGQLGVCRGRLGVCRGPARCLSRVGSVSVEGQLAGCFRRGPARGVSAQLGGKR
jgi:hypothetical protein